MTHPSSTFAGWFLALPDQSQAVVAVGILAATIAFLTFGTSLLSSISSFVSARISGLQAGTATKALFVTLLPRRIEWLDAFRKAVADRQNEIAFGMGPDEHGQIPELLALFQVSDGRRTSRWLFDESVTAIAADIEQLLDTKTRLIIALRAPSRKPTADELNAPSAIAVEIDAKIGELIEHCRPFLYVGDVKRSRREVRVAKRIKGVGTALYSRSAGDRNVR